MKHVHQTHWWVWCARSCGGGMKDFYVSWLQPVQIWKWRGQISNLFWPKFEFLSHYHGYLEPVPVPVGQCCNLHPHLLSQNLQTLPHPGESSFPAMNVCSLSKWVWVLPQNMSDDQQGRSTRLAPNLCSIQRLNSDNCNSKQASVHKGPKNLLIICRDQPKRDI